MAVTSNRKTKNKKQGIDFSGTGLVLANKLTYPVFNFSPLIKCPTRDGEEQTFQKKEKFNTLRQRETPNQEGSIFLFGPQFVDGITF